jgi:hypothetical protein
MSLTHVSPGDPHVSAHNAEIDAINDLDNSVQDIRDLSDTEFKASLNAAYAPLSKAYDLTLAAKAAGKRLRAITTGNRSVTAQGVTVGAIQAASGVAPQQAVNSGLAVTFVNPDHVTVTGHGLAVGDRVGFSTITGTTSVAAYQGYYVRAVWDANNFTIGNAMTGGATGINANGSAATLYKQWPTLDYAYDRTNARVNANLQVLGTRPVQSTATFPRYDYIIPDPTIVTYAPGSPAGTSIDASTAFFGTKINVLLRNGGNDPKRIYVDGLLAATITLANLTSAGITSGSIGRVPLTFPSIRNRTITVLGDDEFPGFETEVAYPISYPSTQPKGPRVLVVGDSFTEGTGATSAGFGFVRWVSWHMGWRDVWRAGSGSTGYVADGTRQALIDRYTNDIITQAPDICVIAMGINDLTDYVASPATVTSAATTIWDAVTAALPNCELVILGPFPNGGGVSVSAGLVAMDAALRALATTRGLRYISPIGEGWTFTRADATHPDDAGHADIAQRVAGHLAVPYVPA